MRPEPHPISRTAHASSSPAAPTRDHRYVETTNVGIYLLTCGATTIIVTLALLVFAVVFANNPRSRLLLKIAAFVLWVTVVYYATFAETAPFKSVSADAIGNG